MEAETPTGAVRRARTLKIHPGGEPMVWKIEPKHIGRVPADLRNKLLSEREVRERLDGKGAFEA